MGVLYFTSSLEYLQFYWMIKRQSIEIIYYRNKCTQLAPPMINVYDKWLFESG